MYSLSFVIKRHSAPPLSPVCLLFPDSLASPSCSSSMVTLLAHWLFSRCSLNWDIKNNICSSIAKYFKKLVSLDRWLKTYNWFDSLYSNELMAQQSKINPDPLFFYDSRFLLFKWVEQHMRNDEIISNLTQTTKKVKVDKVKWYKLKSKLLYVVVFSSISRGDVCVVNKREYPGILYDTLTDYGIRRFFSARTLGSPWIRRRTIHNSLG